MPVRRPWLQKLSNDPLSTFQAMKTKITILAVLVSMLTFTVATTQSAKQPKVALKKSVPVEARMNKGFAMEDKNQFN
jgi:hypothetical protein